MRPRFHTFPVVIWALGFATALVVAACGFPRPSDVEPGSAGIPAQIVMTTGMGQSGPAGSMLAAPFVATVEDANGAPVADVAVDFMVTAGEGSVSTASVATDERGRAETLLTLGTIPGANAVEARVTGLAPVTFTATAVVGAATQIVLTSGNNQTGIAGSPLAEPLVVTVVDVAGNPRPEYMVAFVVTAGGGSVTPASIATDTQGRAQTSLTLGTLVGTNTVEARVAGLATVTFAAVGSSGPASQLVLTSGDGQTGIARSALAAPLVVTVKDANGNAVAGTPLDFVVTTGGGTVSPTSVATDAQGQAQTSLTLGPPGPNTVEARATGLSGSPIVFTATGAVGPASQLVLTSGNHQSAQSGTMLASALVVTVMDASSNPVAGVAIGFVVTAGGGSVSMASVATDAQGQAQTTWTVGTSSVHTLEARATGLVGSPVVFSAVATGFATKVDFPAGGSPGSLTVRDFNGDGKLDLAFVNSDSYVVSIMLNTTVLGAPAPSFAAKVVFPIGDSPYSMAADDLNGDGKPDLVVANYHANTFSVLLNTTTSGATTPSFAKTVLPIGSMPNCVAIGDFDGDGVPDLAITNRSSYTVSVLRNTTAPGATTPSFAARVDLLLASEPSSVAIADVNGDGKPDLAVPVASLNTISVLLNTTATGAATPSFTTSVDFSTGPAFGSVTIADVNGDSRPDLAGASGSSNTVSVLLNTTATGATTPSFATKVDFATGLTPSRVATGDLNGDGKPDFAVTNYYSDTVSVLLNTTVTGATTPSFAAKIDFPTGSGPTFVSIADVNSDGKPDLVVTNGFSNTISVLLAQ